MTDKALRHALKILSEARQKIDAERQGVSASEWYMLAEVSMRLARIARHISLAAKLLPKTETAS